MNNLNKLQYIFAKVSSIYYWLRDPNVQNLDTFDQLSQLLIRALSNFRITMNLSCANFLLYSNSEDLRVID